MRYALIFLFSTLFLFGCKSELSKELNINTSTGEVVTGTGDEIQGKNLESNNGEMVKYVAPKLENGDTVAEMKTNLGTIKIKLFVDKVPTTANNFIGLASEGYYDGIIYHRVIKGFMIQGGDPEGTGMGGASLYGEKFDDEFSEGLSNVVGTISMANSGPDTNGSQFFINVGDNTSLDYDKQPLSSKHSVFGQVVEGYDVVDKISKTKTSAGDKPEKEVKIISVKIKEFDNGKYSDKSIDTEALKNNFNNKLEEKRKENLTRTAKVGDNVSAHYAL